jgi:hypothetical protein
MTEKTEAEEALIVVRELLASAPDPAAYGQMDMDLFFKAHVEWQARVFAALAAVKQERDA